MGTGQLREPPPAPPRPAAQRPRPGPSPHGAAWRGPPGSPRPARTSQRRRRPHRRCPVPAHRARACSPLPPGPEEPRPALLGTCSPARRFLPAPPGRLDYNSQHARRQSLHATTTVATGSARPPAVTNQKAAATASGHAALRVAIGTEESAGQSALGNVGRWSRQPLAIGCAHSSLTNSSAAEGIKYAA